MIYFLTTASHSYTHRAIEESLPSFKRMTYPAVLARKALPAATYVFSDLDRLSPWQLELAARLYRQLKAGGAIVVNDPARMVQRLPLLKRLQRAGVNTFHAWDAAELDTVDRYPVFVRTRFAHRGVLSELLYNERQLATALEGAISDGFTMSDLMIVEFCAQPVRADLYRKHAVYRIGENYVAAVNVHDSTWMAKIGQKGIADQALYDEEHQDVVDNRFAPAMAKVFELAGVEYGRVDFGVVDGRPEIYEVNTNPQIGRPGDHPFPIRIETSRHVFDSLVTGFSALDIADGGPMIAIRIASELASIQRRKRIFPGYQWQP